MLVRSPCATSPATHTQAKDFGISKFSKDLLEVADTVGLAIQHAPMEEVEKKVAEGAPPPPAKVSKRPFNCACAAFWGHGLIVAASR